ncbi:MAG: hypothetical protein QW086_01540 [Pyrobaculum sp.]
MTVKLASGFYADETVLEALMSIPEIYNAYVEGDTAFLEVDDAAAKPGETVRMLMDLGYELVLPHFVFAVKKGDPWRVKDLVEKDLPPHVAASFFNVSSRLDLRGDLPRRLSRRGGEVSGREGSTRRVGELLPRPRQAQLWTKSTRSRP